MKLSVLRKAFLLDFFVVDLDRIPLNHRRYAIQRSRDLHNERRATPGVEHGSTRIQLRQAEQGQNVGEIRDRRQQIE